MCKFERSQVAARRTDGRLEARGSPPHGTQARIHFTVIPNKLPIEHSCETRGQTQSSQPGGGHAKCMCLSHQHPDEGTEHDWLKNSVMNDNDDSPYGNDYLYRCVPNTAWDTEVLRIYWCLFKAQISLSAVCLIWPPSGLVLHVAILCT